MKDFKLDNHPKINPGFNVPEGYFDDFSEKMKNKPLQREPLVVSLFRENKKWISAVAAVFVIALAVSFFLKQETNSDDELDATTTENYVVYQSDISQDDLAMLLTDKDLEKMKVDLKIQDDALENEILDNELEFQP